MSASSWGATGGGSGLREHLIQMIFTWPVDQASDAERNVRLIRSVHKKFRWLGLIPHNSYLICGEWTKSRHLRGKWSPDRAHLENCAGESTNGLQGIQETPETEWNMCACIPVHFWGGGEGRGYIITRVSKTQEQRILSCPMSYRVENRVPRMWWLAWSTRLEKSEVKSHSRLFVRPSLSSSDAADCRGEGEGD